MDRATLCLPWKTSGGSRGRRARQWTAPPSPLRLHAAGVWGMLFLPVLEVHQEKVDLCLDQWMWAVRFPSVVLRSKREKNNPPFFSIREQRKSFVLPFKGTSSSC